ncbi:nitroreductase family protein [Paenibacillus sp. GSMTC-2017]|uniref:nitroreductase family protein n=1 Tax=Paenibacillus sp. GSMTC-2017 TaxID=2794350 RepID=UPI0018D88590|nr:nitroreductase family protein [Paenibacillus sp. GSMTC-2017]MBH5317437.1 nitroreductase family protein [Paenibacillus sp. GSMTC-2017]
MSSMSNSASGALLQEAYSVEVAENRKPDYPVHSLILNRWSPRSYTEQSVSDQDLYTVLEAARWAPSSSNLQPWRFYVATHEVEHNQFRKFIKPRNRLWTDKAPVLLLLASVKVKENGESNGAHAFDAGAAWATLAFQARLLGLSTRAVGGFDHDIARETLETPDDIVLHAVIALGYRGDSDTLDEGFRELEKPNNRRPLVESILPISVVG